MYSSGWYMEKTITTMDYLGSTIEQFFCLAWEISRLGGTNYKMSEENEYGPAPKPEVKITLISIPLEKLMAWIKRIWRWR